jgi:hypothetical protein
MTPNNTIPTANNWLTILPVDALEGVIKITGIFSY